MKKGVIFDMDGTLWDSIDSIVLSWNQALAELGETQAVVTRANITGLMGKTMDQFAYFYFPDYPEERSFAILDYMEKAENEYLRQHGAVLLGDVRAVFQGLRDAGYGVYIVSNCQAGYIEAFLEYYGLEELVDDKLCYGDNKLVKAGNLKLIIQRNQLDQYWYVGDTQGDYDACQEAGVPMIFAGYGFGEVDAQIPVIDHLEDIVAYMKNM